MTATTTFEEVRELDARSGDGLEVQLLWYPETDSVRIAVIDTAQSELFEVAVDPSDALDAFRHPFAYAACREVTHFLPIEVADELTVEP